MRLGWRINVYSATHVASLVIGSTHGDEYNKQQVLGKWKNGNV